MKDYFHNNDRIPVDSCPDYPNIDSEFTDAPYTELPMSVERMLEVDPIIWEKLRQLPMAYEVLRKVRMLICDAFDDGHKQGFDEGRNY